MQHELIKATNSLAEVFAEHVQIMIVAKEQGQTATEISDDTEQLEFYGVAINGDTDRILMIINRQRGTAHILWRDGSSNDFAFLPHWGNTDIMAFLSAFLSERVKRN